MGPGMEGGGGGLCAGGGRTARWGVVRGRIQNKRPWELSLINGIYTSPQITLYLMGKD